MNFKTKKISISILSLWLISTALLAQDKGYQMAGNKDEIQIDFLGSYYQQDGNNAAVTGGIGTEKLQDIASMLVVNIPLDSINAISIMAGADTYSSASTDNIDNNRSSASSHDVRAYTNLGYTRKNLRRGETYGIKAGFSTEYDYTSINGGLSYAKEFNEGNSEFSVNALAFFDQWQLIYPIELRSTVSLPTKQRQSFTLQTNFAQVLNKRMQFSLSAEAIYMKGLLSTPFHRVYFQSTSTPDIERLPDTRLKIPVGVRLNIFPSDDVVLRSYYRYYWDDWGIQAHTASLEIPVKINTTLTVYPFYRYHTQTAADYFAPYQAHTVDELFYTSDYDLSALDSHTAGFGFKIAPVYGLARGKVPFSSKSLMFKSLDFRAAYYHRSTGLKGFAGSINLSFVIK